MIRIGILGDIGSGKSYIAKKFGYPVFNADIEVAKLYKKEKKIFIKLKKILPKYFNFFPVDKKEVSRAILADKSNLRKIVKIIHQEIRKNLNVFLKKNRNKRIIILDIPLLLENKINLDLSNIGKNKYFYDIIYNPKETHFLKTGRNLGNKSENGKLMFIYQALAAFKVWHGIYPKINDDVIKLLD